MTASFRSLQLFRMGRFSALNSLKSRLTDLDGPAMSAMGQKRTWQRILRMSALPPKADINHRERDVGFVPFCSVDNLARNTEGAHGRSSAKSLICWPAASDR